LKTDISQKQKLGGSTQEGPPSPKKKQPKRKIKKRNFIKCQKKGVRISTKKDPVSKTRLKETICL